MRDRDFTEHLERAFTREPGDLSKDVEATFRKGERAMKKRHKLMIALSAAAACAVAFAALALATGRLARPNPDRVAAPRLASELQEVKSEELSSVSNEAATKKGQSTRMTAREAWERLLEADPTAGESGEVWIYLSGEADAAWAFYATNRDAKQLLWSGAAWFIGEECVCLGRSRNVAGWYFFSQQPGPNPDVNVDPLEARSGIKIAYGPELFASVIRKGGKSTAHIWTLGADGLPLELDTGNGLCDIQANFGVLCGMPENDNCDFCFLHVHDGVLYQVTAQQAAVEAVEALPGAAESLAELRRAGYAITGCLYRGMDGTSGAGAAAVTVNLAQDGKEYHTYLYRASRKDRLQAARDWEDDIAVYPGAGTLNPDAGLPALASGTLETAEAARTKGQAG